MNNTPATETKRAFTGKFSMLANEWKVIVNTGTPQRGDEIRVRKADKSVVTVTVEAVTGTYDGKAVCRTTQRKTESAHSQQYLAGSIYIYPATHPVDTASARRISDRIERREGRTAYERKYQIGL